MTNMQKGQHQRERVFKFVENYIKKNGIAPLYSEILDALGIAPSHIQYILKQLNKNGKLIWLPGILDGDLVIGQVTDKWNPRDMVAAWLVEEKLATLKRIEETDRLNVRLVPANPAF